MFCFPCLFAKDQASARRTGAGRALAGTRQQAIEPGWCRTLDREGGRPVLGQESNGFIWRFPEMKVPLNHPCINGFSIINQPFWDGNPIFGTFFGTLTMFGSSETPWYYWCMGTFHSFGQTHTTYEETRSHQHAKIKETYHSWLHRAR